MMVYIQKDCLMMKHIQSFRWSIKTVAPQRDEPSIKESFLHEMKITSSDDQLTHAFQVSFAI